LTSDNHINACVSAAGVQREDHEGSRPPAANAGYAADPKMEASTEGFGGIQD
jgi:hypothetical protein